MRIVGITTIYVGVMVLGLLWIVFRVKSYLRSQKESEYRWDEAMYKDGFRPYPDKLKEQSIEKDEMGDTSKTGPLSTNSNSQDGEHHY
ncbi:MAG: hypothetical protein WBG50_28430 [Desulfomonilaceae bacterium]